MSSCHVAHIPSPGAGQCPEVPQDGVNLRCEGLAAWGRAGKLIATLLALLLGLAGRRAIADDAVTLTFGACLHQCSPPAGVIMQSAGGISQSSHENTITIWLKPSESLRCYKPLEIE